MLKKTLLLVAVFLPLSASAASLHFGDYFLKGAEKVPSDVYTVGRTATLAGTILGDLTSISRTIFSQSDIAGDVFFLGEEIRIEGPVGDDVRVVGGTVTINSIVSGDVVVIGSSVVLGPKAEVKGSLYVIGGQAEIKGTVAGEAKVLSGDMTLTGAIEGDLELWGKAVFAEPSRIGGDFIQHSKTRVAPPVNVAITGKVIIDEAGQGGMSFGNGFLGGFFALKVLMMLALGFALFFLARGRTEDVLLEAMPFFWMRALRGLLILIVLPLAAVLLLPSVVGIPIAIILGALLLILLILAWGCAGILLGAWSERLFFKRSAFPLSYRPVLLGTLFLSVISLIPFLGPLFHGILMLATAGSMGTLFFKYLRVVK